MDLLTSLIGNMRILLASATEEASGGNVLTTFGVDFPKFAAQVILFGIVYKILSRFAFKPITSLLEERTKRIAEGEENLKKIAKDLEETELKRSEIIAEANSKAELLISEARQSADALAEKKRDEATKEAATIVAKAHDVGELEQEQMRAELKRDFGRLVVDTTTKVTGKVLNDEDQEAINKETSSQIAL